VNASTWWVLAPELLTALIAVALLLVGVLSTGVAVEFINRLEVEASASGATPPVPEAVPWAAGRGGVSPAASPGGPPT
jgi:hypothetical protein